MNKITFAAGAAIFALTAALSACSSDEDAGTVMPQDKVVRVTANVGDMTTRGSYDTQSLDSMGLGIKNANSDTYSYSNVKFTKTGNAWTPTSTLLWQDDDKAVDIVAYAPYKKVDTLTTNLCDQKQFPVEVQTVQGKDDNSSDFLVFKHAGFVPQADLVSGAVPVTLSHAMSRLTLKIKFGTEFDANAKLTANPVTSLTIGGTIVKGQCDFTATLPTVTAQAGQAAEAVTPYESADFQPATGEEASQEKNNAIATYECILVPQRVEAGTFSVTLSLNGKVYTWTSPSAVTLDANSSYTLTLTIGRDAIVESGLSVKAWTSQTAMERETD